MFIVGDLVKFKVQNESSLPYEVTRAEHTDTGSYYDLMYTGSNRKLRWYSIEEERLKPYSKEGPTMFSVGDIVRFKAQTDTNEPYFVIARYDDGYYDLKRCDPEFDIKWDRIDGDRLCYHYGPEIPNNAPMTLSIQGLLFAAGE